MKTYNLAFDKESFFKEIYTISAHIDPNTPIFAQIFSSSRRDKEDLKQLFTFLRLLFPKIVLFGCSSESEFIDASISQNQIIVSISHFEDTRLELAALDYKGFGSYEEFGKVFVNKFSKDPQLLLLFLAGKNVNGDDFLSGIKDFLPHTTLAGGIASGERSYIFDQDHFFEEGVVAIALYSDSLFLKSFHKNGWLPIGKEMVITKAHKNRVYTIDHLLAADLYKHSLGSESSYISTRVWREFPLIKLEHDTMRAPSSINEDGSIFFNGHFDEGERVCFGHGSREFFLGESLLIPESFYKFHIESVFIYSSIAREKLMPDGIHREIEPYSNLSECVGFFTSGEFTTQEGQHLFLNQSMSILALSENPQIQTVPLHPLASIKDLEYYYSQKATSNLIKHATQELDTLNKTLEKQVKEKLLEIRRKDILLLQQSKRISLGEMIGNIAHQWRQPLNAIGALNMQLETLLGIKDSIGYEEYEKIGEKINEQLEFLSTTIDDFRLFAKDNNKAEEFDLFTTIQTVASLIDVHFKQENIKIYIDGFSCLLYGPKSEFKHALLNILNNAKDAIKSYRVSRHEEHAIWISMQQKPHELHLCIKDTGGGIDDAIISKIFDPYFTTKFKNQGSGIGLFMTYEIISKHFEGDIEVQTYEATDKNLKHIKGSIFTLIFNNLHKNN